jgi:hypothetical protein
VEIKGSGVVAFSQVEADHHIKKHLDVAPWHFNLLPGKRFEEQTHTAGFGMHIDFNRSVGITVFQGFIVPDNSTLFTTILL